MIGNSGKPPPFALAVPPAAIVGIFRLGSAAWHFGQRT
jgi:hypothetical protein